MGIGWPDWGWALPKINARSIGMPTMDDASRFKRSAAAGFAKVMMPDTSRATMPLEAAPKIWAVMLDGAAMVLAGTGTRAGTAGAGEGRATMTVRAFAPVPPRLLAVTSTSTR